MIGALVVGREAEREAIEAWLDADRPSSLLIDGEAGIGKSTLWSHALERAEARGQRVISWRASIAERELAFAVLTALFDSPAIIASLAHIPEARHRALETALGREGPESQASDPSLVGLAVADALRILASQQPTIVAIDDLQWSDRASEDAMAFAARRLRTEPLGFILARRTGQSPTGAADDASGPGNSLANAIDRRQQIDLGPLSVGALGRLIHERLGVAHPRPLLVRLHEACSGNPFLALEISRSLLARTVALTPGEPFPVPPEVGPLVRDHLSSLTSPARRALVLVAMSSQPTMNLLDAILGDAAAAAVDEAYRAGVLVAEGDRLRATHPLFASTAFADSPPGERRAMRAALAEAVDDPLERAIHRAATAEGRDTEVANQLEAAARLALGRGAPSVAADLFARAADVGGIQAQSLRIESAAARLACGDSVGAMDLLRRVLAGVPGGQVRAKALLALGEIVYVDNPSQALPLLIEALDHTEGDPLLEAGVHVHISAMGDANPIAVAASTAAAVRLLELPGVQAAPELLGAALIERAYQWLLRCERLALDDVDRGLGLLVGAPDSFITRTAQERGERCLYHVGRLRESLAFDEVEYERLVERGDFGLLPPIVQSMSVLEQLLGDWPAARRHAQQCLDLVEQGEEMWRHRAMMARGRVLAWEGDLTPARAIAIEALAREERAGDAWESVIFCTLLGFIELSVPDPPAALGYLMRAVAYTDTLEVTLPTVFRHLGDVVEAAVLAGDLELAERVLVERLEEPARRVPVPWILAMAARGRGLLAMARGEFDGAVASLDRAIDVFDTSLPMPFERARTVLARGQAHRRAGRRRAARDDIGAARATFEGLGAKAWSSRADEELGRIAGRTPVQTALTVSERVVADLAAAGRSNREIAAVLVVSVRTVESQLSAAYRKLDIRSRGQLPAALRTAGEATT